MSEKKQTAANQAAMKVGTEAVTKGIEQVMSATKEQVEKFAPNAAKGFDDASRIGKGNVDAAVKAGTIAAKGFETIGKELTDFNKMVFETSMANTKALFGAKTVQEAIELQTGFAREGFETFVAQGTKISELSVKVAQDVAEPLSTQATAAAQEFVKPLSA